ncbi:probable cytochrome P450 6a13 [Coccinella septempunctata]|uniref:probable cytochrome P450 6a13 n=1 Tax=Coccinella septempunctata TaxID=41139 RepID=UPI001D0849DF|nr:probable cytochrome P450 6a13 [Coccinella septempunctata]
MFLAILLIWTLTLFYIYTNISLRYWRMRNVFTKKPLPIFGNLFDVILGKDEFWTSISKIYNEIDDKYPYFGFYIFHKPILVLKDINIIKQVLVKDFNSFPNRTLHSNEKVDPVISNTLFVLKDDVWRTFRRKLSPIMSSGKMKLIIPSMQEHAVNLEHCLENSVEKNIDVKDLAKRFMLDAFASFAFGIDYGSLQNKNLLMKQEHDRVFDQTKVMRRIGTFSWVFSPILVDIFRLPFMDMKYAHNLLDFYLQAEIDRKKENIQRNDLLDILIELSQQKSPNNVHEFDDLRRSAQAVLFSGTGTESTALPLALGLHELACHPDIQDELRREIYQNLDIDGNVTYESLNKMKYLDMVVKETLRLHPFLPFVTRYASEDYKIESTGLIIEKGTQILVPTRAIHKDPKYFPEPLKFKPERFLGENMNKFQNVYLPFGAGPRKCIAERLSLIAMKYGIAACLKNFQVLVGEKTDLPLKFAKNSVFTSTEDGCVYLKIKRLI